MIGFLTSGSLKFYSSSPGNVLHVAVRGRLIDLALHLISQGVDVGSCNEMGRTPLMQACIKNTPEVIAGLLSARADVNVKDRGGRSALYCAALKEHAEVVNQLTASGVDQQELQELSHLLESMDLAPHALPVCPG